MATKKVAKKKKSKFWKITIGVLAFLAVGTAIFCGLYFGVPSIHDAISGVEGLIHL